MEIKFGRYGRASVRLWPLPMLSVGHYYDFGLSRHGWISRRDDGGFYETASQLQIVFGKRRFAIWCKRESGLS